MWFKPYNFHTVAEDKLPEAGVKEEENDHECRHFSNLYPKTREYLLETMICSKMNFVKQIYWNFIFDKTNVSF